MNGRGERCFYRRHTHPLPGSASLHAREGGHASGLTQRPLEEHLDRQAELNRSIGKDRRAPPAAIMRRQPFHVPGPATLSHMLACVAGQRISKEPRLLNAALAIGLEAMAPQWLDSWTSSSCASGRIRA